MLTDTSLGLITFINLFFIPILSLRIYCKRNSIEWKFNFDLVYRYTLFCILNLPFTRVFTAGLEKILHITCLADSSKYTLVAIVTAAILPFLVEIVEHYVHVDVSITYSKDKKQKQDKEKENQ